ncbi:MAG: hypothetical protein ABS84_13380 [Rubrivivax sp. SCN 71-131]|nr:MAG: hypothetical protein ABS84_13380 [Rubrivivax sp. SCN 71-131]
MSRSAWPRILAGPVLVDSGPLIALFNAAARLKLRHLLSIDADFDVYRDRAGRPLVNLLRG